MKSSTISTQVIGFALLIILFSARISAQTNKINLGTVSLEVRMHGDVPPPDHMEIFTSELGLYDSPLYIHYHDLTYEGNGVFRISFPTETEKSIAGFQINNRNIREILALGIVELVQGDTLVLDCTFTGSELTVTPSSSEGFNHCSMKPDRNPAKHVIDTFMELQTFSHGQKPMTGITDPEKIYAAGEDAWREVLRQTEEVYSPYLDDQVLKDLYDGRERELLQSQIDYYIYGTQYLRYDKNREYYAREGNRDLPPLEYYDFMNRIDFSYLTMPYIFYTPYIILRNIIQYLPVGIEPIGDTPVHEWKRQTAQKLGLVLNNVPDILLSMISAASYQMQLDDEIRPFSATQVRNISEGYDDDLGKILLGHNDKLKAQLSRMGPVQDLTDRTEFDLRKYIDEKYPGKPVVVDFWNTWCGPCIQAHRDTETVRQMPEAEGVVFLYISDTSSPDKDFRRIAPGIDGEHLRLDQPVVYSMLEEEGLNGFPSYFFYDREHHLVHKQTTFPGADAYRDIIGKLR